MKSVLRAMLAAAWLIGLEAMVHAAEPSIELAPAQGSQVPLRGGVTEIVVRITNPEARPSRGSIQVENVGFSGSVAPRHTSSPFTVGAGSSAIVRVPAIVEPLGSVAVEVLDEQRSVIKATQLNVEAPTDDVVMLDVSNPSLLRATLNEVGVLPTSAHAPSYRGSDAKLFVGAPSFDRVTGDPILPERPASYSGVDAVVVRQLTLAHLSDTELSALAGFVLGGGTLAVIVTRPEDLASDRLRSFAGGFVHKGPVGEATKAEMKLRFGPKDASPIPLAPDAPTPEVAADLSGFEGGNLHASAYGSSASYGLGEVHLLSFDPTRKPAAEDAWALARMVDLARRAHDRLSAIAVQPGRSLEGVSTSDVSRLLDPNASSRWAIGAATLVLCIYAVLAGPLSFSRAARKGRPLDAIKRLPVFALVTLLVILGIGVGAKGVRGRARHLTIIESGAGFSRGIVRRFRGFFSPRSGSFSARSTSASDVVQMLPEGDHVAEATLVGDRDATRLTGLDLKPWETTVIREDGTVDIGDGVAIVRRGSDAVVRNRTGHDLSAALLVVPSPPKVVYFGRIPNGDEVSSASGAALDRTFAERAFTASLLPSSSAPRMPGSDLLDASRTPPCLDADAPGIRAALEALSAASSKTSPWFLGDVPVLLAQLEGGEGASQDEGFRLESDRVIVRIVGWGGPP